MSKRNWFMACILVLMCSVAAATKGDTGVLMFPAALQIIEEEAFYGNTSVDKVVIPAGTTEIRSKAFAYSTFRPTLEYICLQNR